MVVSTGILLGVEGNFHEFSKLPKGLRTLSCLGCKAFLVLESNPLPSEALDGRPGIQTLLLGTLKANDPRLPRKAESRQLPLGPTLED